MGENIEDNAKWQIVTELDKNSCAIQNVSTKRFLSCQTEKGLSGVLIEDDNRDGSCNLPSWSVENLTGELCFQSSTQNDDQLKCVILAVVN